MTSEKPAAKPKEAAKLLGDVQRPPKGSKVHFCILCDHPIAIYGRLAPCLHCFCLTCASTLTSCTTCKSEIDIVERIVRAPGKKLYMSPATLQGFTNHQHGDAPFADQDDFLQHAQHLSSQLAAKAWG